MACQWGTLRAKLRTMLVEQESEMLVEGITDDFNVCTLLEMCQLGC